MHSWINPRIEVGDAGPKGKGLFAKEAIKQGEIIVIAGGQIVPDDFFGSPPFDVWNNICFSVEKGFSICPSDLDIERREGVFMMNHSCEPNCGLGGQITFVAMRDIQRGEELTFDYAMTDGDFRGMHKESMNQWGDDIECFCGSPNCRRIITGDDWKRKDLQEKYKGYFMPYIQAD